MEHPELVTKMKESPFMRIMEGLDPRDMEIHYDEIKSYPGSAKGPSAYDNPEHYSEWLTNNMPRALKLFKNRVDDISSKVIEEFHGEMDQVRPKVSVGVNHTSVKDIAESEIMNFQYANIDLESETLNQGTNFEINSPMNDRRKSGLLPDVPENIPLEWDTSIWFCENWHTLTTISKYSVCLSSVYLETHLLVFEILIFLYLL